MEKLELIKRGKLNWKDSFRTYGEYLLEKLQKLHPNIPMIGRMRAPVPPESGYEELYFTIKEGKGIFAKINPFNFKKLARVYEHYQSGPWAPKTVTVFNPSLKKSVEQIVSELNKKSGRCFSVKYS